MSYQEHDRRVWEDIFAGMPAAWYDAPASDVMTRCRSFFENNRVQRLLDVGCGFGRWAAHLAGPPAASVVGVDYAVGGIRAAQRYAMEGLPVRFAVGSALELPARSHSHDGVLAALLLDNLSREDALIAMSEINRVTTPGAPGFFVFNPTPSPDRPADHNNPTASCMHVAYGDDELEQVLSGWGVTVSAVSAEGFRIRAGTRRQAG